MSADSIRDQIAAALANVNGFIPSPLDAAGALLAAIPVIAALDHAREAWVLGGVVMNERELGEDPVVIRAIGEHVLIVPIPEEA